MLLGENYCCCEYLEVAVMTNASVLIGFKLAFVAQRREETGKSLVIRCGISGEGVINNSE